MEMVSTHLFDGQFEGIGTVGLSKVYTIYRSMREMYRRYIAVHYFQVFEAGFFFSKGQSMGCPDLEM